MKQQINLYLPEFRKEKDWLELNNMIAVLALAVAVLVVVSGVEYWNLYSLNRELEDRQQERENIAAQTQALIQSYGVQTEDPALRAEVTALEAELESNEALLNFLDGRNIGSTAGFSEYLADLARYHLGGLRLTRVRLLDGGSQVELNGEVISAELVPRYLQNLRKGQSFSGKEFELLRITDEGNTSGARPLKSFNVATTN